MNTKIEEYARHLPGCSLVKKYSDSYVVHAAWCPYDNTNLEERLEGELDVCPCQAGECDCGLVKLLGLTWDPIKNGTAYLRKHRGRRSTTCRQSATLKNGELSDTKKCGKPAVAIVAWEFFDEEVVVTCLECLKEVTEPDSDNNFRFVADLRIIDVVAEKPILSLASRH